MNPSSPASPGKSLQTSEASRFPSRIRAHMIVWGRMGWKVAKTLAKIVLWPVPTVAAIAFYASAAATGHEPYIVISSIMLVVVPVANILAFTNRKDVAAVARDLTREIKHDWERAKQRYNLAVDEAQKKLGQK